MHIKNSSRVIIVQQLIKIYYIVDNLIYNINVLCISYTICLFIFQKETQPKPPAYIFVIDVSYNNIKSGLVRLVCAFMKELLMKLPTELGEEKSKIRVGFITYDTTVHFYNVKVR